MKRKAIVLFSIIGVIIVGVGLYFSLATIFLASSTPTPSSVGNAQIKELKFIHITKCAGTSLEDIAKEKGIFWGRHHKEYGYWHEIFSKKGKDLKDKYDWFMIVRNPYDRILSEYHCKWGGNGKRNNFTKEEFNKFLIKKINKRSESGDHYTEQYKYLDKDYNIKILKFENLNEEFNNLMDFYNIDLKLDRHNNKSADKKFSMSDFSEELLKLIHLVYKKDFMYFGYNMLSDCNVPINDVAGCY